MRHFLYSVSLGRAPFTVDGTCGRKRKIGRKRVSEEQFPAFRPLSSGVRGGCPWKSQVAGVRYFRPRE